ncbi:TetR/AcrR family transcriptional regulator [Dendrosporobacter sp. 1207_IL3150]|uniref:TetR/AcrR family transcriptional regulator n=1 Tax=Dendrosporobacter sp. 1207_IL3150 TaxID=3084054 RepID=UPI002FDAFBB9
MVSINRRERKKLNSKKAIIDAAVKLFITKGYKDTAIAEIMNEADLGIGTFYNYFESKEEILKHFLTEIISKANKHCLSLLDEPKSSSEILTEMFLFTGRILDENRFVLPLFLSAAHRSGSTAKVFSHPTDGITFRSIFNNIIKSGQQRGEFRNDIPAEVITEMFHSIFQTASFSSLELSFMQNIQYKLKLTLDGLLIRSQNTHEC